MEDQHRACNAKEAREQIERAAMLDSRFQRSISKSFM